MLTKTRMVFKKTWSDRLCMGAYSVMIVYLVYILGCAAINKAEYLPSVTTYQV